jgi:hypothetical protein
MTPGRPLDIKIIKNNIRLGFWQHIRDIGKTNNYLPALHASSGDKEIRELVPSMLEGIKNAGTPEFREFFPGAIMRIIDYELKEKKGKNFIPEGHFKELAEVLDSIKSFSASQASRKLEKYILSKS